MQAIEYLHQYLEGWRLGGGALSLDATAPEFHYDDPNTGRIARESFINFVEDFKAAVAEGNGGRIGHPFLQYTETLISEKEGIAWCWWHAVGSSLEGAALIRFGPDGIESEKIGYFTKLP